MNEFRVAGFTWRLSDSGLFLVGEAINQSGVIERAICSLKVGEIRVSEARNRRTAKRQSRRMPTQSAGVR